MRVGTCTCDRATSEAIKASIEGSSGKSEGSIGGVDGGVGWPFWLTVLVTCASQRMTWAAC